MTRLSGSWAGENYAGEFLDGEFSGQGTYSLNSGYKTVGIWREGKLNGPALMYDANSAAVNSGFYRNGKLVPSGRLSAEQRRFLSAYRGEVEVERLAKQAAQAEQQRVADERDRQRREQQRVADERERERIEREGDGSTDDLACKGKKLIPATDPYRNCRAVLVADRERKAQRERELAEKQERDRAERERVAAAEAEAVSHRYYERLEREGRAALARERALTAAREVDPFYDAKAQCRELGFKPNTEKFGTCVLELRRRQPVATTPSVNTGDGSPDDTACRGYGFPVETSGYSNCRMTLDNARRSYELELRTYEAAKAEYQRRAAEAEAEAQRARAQRQAQVGYCLTQCRGGFLECFARCGAQSAGVSYDPGPAPTRPSGRTTYVINGQVINCNTSLSGSLVTCNLPLRRGRTV